MKPIFEKIILLNGKCALAIQTPSARREHAYGHELTPTNANNECGVDCHIITDTVLHMLSEAYAAGYEEALLDASIAIGRIETKKPNKVETSDYRQHLGV